MSESTNPLEREHQLRQELLKELSESGRLQKMFLIPLDWGGENFGSNIMMATPEMADAKRQLDIALEPLVNQGVLSQYEVSCRLKTRILVCGAEIDHEGNITYKISPASKHRDYLSTAIADQPNGSRLAPNQDDSRQTSRQAICYCIDSDLDPSVDSASMVRISNQAFSLRRIFAKAEIQESSLEFCTEKDSRPREFIDRH